MNVGVFWRKYRNVEFQRKITSDEVKDDSYEEALFHSEALEEAGFNTVLIQWKDNPIEIYKELVAKEVELVFNASSQNELTFLETFDIPYVGSSATICGLDKAFRKMIVSYHNIVTPKFTLANSIDDIPEINFDYPIFIKPLEGRGSGGIDDSNIVECSEDLPKVVDKIVNEIGQVALIEEFIEGKEITVGILGYKDPKLLPIAEIVYTNSRTNTYNQKMNEDDQIICPAVFSEEVENNIKKIALKIYKVLDIYDYGRIDFILDKNNVPYFLEINTFAGLKLPDETNGKKDICGYMGYMAKVRGYNRGELLKKIVDSSIDRYELNYK